MALFLKVSSLYTLHKCLNFSQTVVLQVSFLKCLEDGATFLLDLVYLSSFSSVSGAY